MNNADKVNAEGLFDGFDRWCYSEMTPYSLEQLGNDAWLTGCPLCGSSDCGRNVTPEQKAEADEFFASNDEDQPRTKRVN
jgi:hypothetical protein